MEKTKKDYQNLVSEIAELKLQLEEANETIDAIRNGQVDALVVKTNDSHELYTLKSADQTYRVFIEKMTEGAITLNADGIIVYCNSQFGKMVGVPLSKITGVPFASFISPGYESDYESLIETGWRQHHRGELMLAGPEKMIPVQLSITTLEMDEGTSLSIIITDLTAQKQTQLLLKINNEKLHEINLELEASNHDLYQFASVASHDLQEPLRKIQIFSNFLKEKYADQLPEEGIRYVQKIISSSDRMKKLIVAILNYSHLSQEANVYAVTDLNILVNEVLEDYELLLQEKGGKVVVENLPCIEANAGQLMQVFQNLISNSLKFTYPGVAPLLHISAEIRRQEDREKCYLSFKDNGIGFDDKFAKNIFTLFRRLHTKDKFEGTGIGLAISKRIIEKHGGHIIAKSQVGNGSSFIIILPITQSSQ